MIRYSRALLGTAIFASVVIGVVIAVVLAGGFTTVQKVDGSNLPLSTNVESVETGTPPEVDTVAGSRESELSVDSMREVRYHCLSRYPEWTNECFQALDAHFLPLEPPVNADIENTMPMTYSELLSNVETKRQTVLTALADPLCSISEDSLRPDLYTRCHGETIVHFARFLDECTNTKQVYLQEDSRDFEYRRSLNTHLAGVQREYHRTQEGFARALEEAEEDFYRAGWLVSKCHPLLERYGPPVTSTELDFSIKLYATIDTPLPPVTEDVIAHRRAVFAEKYTSEEPWLFDKLLKGLSVREFRKLASLAARLGDEWAQLNSDGGSPRYMDALRQVNPLAWHYQQTWNAELGPVSQIRHAVITEQLAYAKNLTVDQTLLYDIPDGGLEDITPEQRELGIAEGMAEYRRLYGQESTQLLK